jgi:putative oxidoreductase
MKELIISNSVMAKDVGLLIMRIGIGVIFIKHGVGKLGGGYDKWVWAGTQMGLLGITWFPVFWGLCAACAEFFGGLALAIGIGTRIAAFFMAITMIVATAYHISNNDPFTAISHPLSLLVVFVGFMIAGAGRYSIDFWLSSH